MLLSTICNYSSFIYALSCITVSVKLIHVCFYLCLIAYIRRLVKHSICKAIRQILLLHIVIWIVVRVFVPIAGSLFALLGVSLLFIFVSLALGLLISCITHTQVAALLVSAMVLMIPTIILSGIIFPIESMPGILQVLSCLIPARWYVETVRRLMIEGVPLVYVWKEVAVMCLMAVVLITATARKFKNRLE
mgnify:CR=1 FL=1